PPGHGLVFLATLALSRSPLTAHRPRFSIGLLVSVGIAWALWGLFLSPRLDTAGALFVVFWIAMIAGGRAPLLLACAFIVTGVVEVAGTQTGAWAWSTVDPAGLLHAGNPPSGCAGIYGWVDIIVLAATPGIVRAMRWTGRRVGEWSAWP